MTSQNFKTTIFHAVESGVFQNSNCHHHNDHLTRAKKLAGPCGLPWLQY
jgi:hypothetical protein